MEQAENRKNLVKVLKEVDKWSIKDKIKFFEKIGESIPIGTRSIMMRDEITETQKIEALRTLSEFHHNMNKIKKSLSSTVGMKFGMHRIYDSIRSMAKRNDKLIASEIAFCIDDAFYIMNLLSIKKNNNYDLEPSIYRLLENDTFENNIDKTIGEENINNLEGFILGYFYAIDSNEISMHGTRAYPNLKKIEDWISDNKIVKHWKTELATNSKRNLVKEFLKRYRNEIIESD